MANREQSGGDAGDGLGPTDSNPRDLSRAGKVLAGDKTPHEGFCGQPGEAEPCRALMVEDKYSSVSDEKVPGTTNPILPSPSPRSRQRERKTPNTQMQGSPMRVPCGETSLSADLAEGKAGTPLLVTCRDDALVGAEDAREFRLVNLNQVASSTIRGALAWTLGARRVGNFKWQ